MRKSNLLNQFNEPPHDPVDEYAQAHVYEWVNWTQDLKSISRLCPVGQDGYEFARCYGGAQLLTKIAAAIETGERFRWNWRRLTQSQCGQLSKRGPRALLLKLPTNGLFNGPRPLIVWEGNVIEAPSHPQHWKGDLLSMEWGVQVLHQTLAGTAGRFILTQRF